MAGLSGSAEVCDKAGAWSDAAPELNARGRKDPIIGHLGLG